MSHRPGAWVLPIVLLAVLQGAAYALDPSLTLLQYIHTSWTRNEDAPLPAITALAQTTDGYLWLGTRYGLLRFDGLRFSPWTPPAGESLPDNRIRALAAAPNGGLWIGTAAGLMTLERGHLSRYRGQNEFAEGTIAALQVDRRGRLWASGMRQGAPLLAVLDGRTSEAA